MQSSNCHGRCTAMKLCDNARFELKKYKYRHAKIEGMDHHDARNTMKTTARTGETRTSAAAPQMA